MNSGKLPPPFVVGEKYWDRNGEYTIIAADGGHVTIERKDGRRTTADAEMKARIHRNVVMERDTDLGGARASRSRQRREPTRREKGLLAKILELEADGADHSGVEIDLFLLPAPRVTLATLRKTLLRCTQRQAELFSAMKAIGPRRR